jgi:hypothetical protein
MVVHLSQAFQFLPLAPPFRLQRLELSLALGTNPTFPLKQHGLSAVW